MSGGRLTSYLEKFYIEQDFLCFRPETLVSCLERAQLEPVRVHRELTDLRRLTFSPPMHLVLQGFSVAAPLFGEENRLFAVARMQGPRDASLGGSGR